MSKRRWEIPCPDCKGTGICATNNPGPSVVPHSCCGDCDRVSAPVDKVPPGSFGIYRGQVTIGSGVLHVNFWCWLKWKMWGRS